ncbi:two-component sensor histidine kinase [Fischerella thermalis WC442]|uniref:sensor histidine kinase n=3 Tax=Fischerella thermalis TaxID=372787 RepID=UPI000C7FA553|nr:sensor histidine kinase [Fischerella thermalis]PLZ28144.1 two-component sensor histidine kinase [Fischerella thermalis WC558]PLZ46581.1 two-component sensor histidine kinase [Fischerella thermalis WC442]PLZ53585.1 two-component sensor histidine kinase [Fischerella thermalis WC439]
MSRPINISNHPFRFLLYLEWVLLIISAFAVLIPSHFQRFNNQSIELTILSLLVFGLMGLSLPTNNKKIKVIYTIIEVILILFISFYNTKPSGRFFPFLYLVLVTRSCFIFQMQGRLIITALSFILFMVSLSQRKPPRVSVQIAPFIQERFLFYNFVVALLFGLALVFVLMLMNTILSERKSRDELAIANEKLRQYALKIENQATLEERNRIAREIHDSLGHSLTALNLQLETAQKLWQSNPEKAQTFLARAKELGSKALQDVRQSVSTMRSHPLQEQSLEQAIANLAENMQRTTGILPMLKINLAYPISAEISTPIYRIIQESFTNICKYAQATKVKLELTTTDTTLYLLVEDNGKGFDLGQNTTGFGQQSMRDRTLALGGKFNINSTPGSGCQIKVEIPLLRYR